MASKKEKWNKTELLANLLSYRKRNPSKGAIDFLRIHGKQAYPVLDSMAPAEAAKFFSRAKPISKPKSGMAKPISTAEMAKYDAPGAKAGRAKPISAAEMAKYDAPGAKAGRAKPKAGRAWPITLPEGNAMGAELRQRMSGPWKGTDYYNMLDAVEKAQESTPDPGAKPLAKPKAGRAWPITLPEGDAMGAELRQRMSGPWKGTDYYNMLGAVEKAQEPTPDPGLGPEVGMPISADTGPGTAGISELGDPETKSAVGSGVGDAEFKDPEQGQMGFDPFAEEQDRRAQMAAAASSMPDILTYGSGSRSGQVTSGVKSDVGLQQERDWKALEQRAMIENSIARQQQLTAELNDKVKASETQYANLEAENASKSAIVKSKLMEAESARDDAVNEYQEKQKGFDPGRFWRNKSGFDKAMFVIGAALEGAAEGFSGGKVKGGDIIGMVNKLVARDINAQLAEIKMAKGRYELKNNSVDYYTKRLGSVNAAITQDKRDKIMDLRRLLLMHETNAKTVQEKLQAREYGMRLDIENIDLKQKQFQEAQDRTTTGWTKGYRQGPNTAKGAVMGALAKGSDKKILPPVFMKQYTGVESAISQVNDILKAGKDWYRGGQFVPGSEPQRIRDQMINNLAVTIRNAEETGVMTEPDVKRAFAQIQRTHTGKAELYKRLHYLKSRMERAQMRNLSIWGTQYEVRGLAARAMRNTRSLPKGSKVQE
jgi:hypothetical protein